MDLLKIMIFLTTRFTQACGFDWRVGNSYVLCFMFYVLVVSRVVYLSGYERLLNFEQPYLEDYCPPV